MAEIAVINKDNTDYDIRDKKLADHTSASTDTSKVSSASSIMLEASDGSFVSVKRDSFVNAIRDVLGSSIVANTGGTSDVNTIPALTSSGGLKSVSTADIASVLGVRENTITNAYYLRNNVGWNVLINDDLNNHYDLSHDSLSYTYFDSCAHSPCSAGFLLTMYSSYSGKIGQIAMDISWPCGDMYSRAFNGQWYDWRKMT